MWHRVCRAAVVAEPLARAPGLEPLQCRHHRRPALALAGLERLLCGLERPPELGAIEPAELP